LKDDDDDDDDDDDVTRNFTISIYTGHVLLNGRW